MSLYRILHYTANQLDDAATLLEQATLTKQASAVSVDRAKLAALAKTAGDKLLKAGLISSPEKRDIFISEIMSHEAALHKLAKLADVVAVPSIGKVTKTAAPVQPQVTSEDVWARHVLSAMSRLGTR